MIDKLERWRLSMIDLATDGFTGTYEEAYDNAVLAVDAFIEVVFKETTSRKMA